MNNIYPEPVAFILIFGEGIDLIIAITDNQPKAYKLNAPLESKVDTSYYTQSKLLKQADFKGVS